MAHANVVITLLPPAAPCPLNVHEFCGSLVRFSGAPHLPPRSFPLQTLVIPFAATHVGFAILFAQLLVGERLTAHDVAGSVLVAAGIVIVDSRGSRTHKRFFVCPKKKHYL